MAAYSDEEQQEMLEGLVFFAEKRFKTHARRAPKASFFRLQAPFSARHAPLSRLISLHERRSRNMTARIEGRGLAISARQQLNRRRARLFWPFPPTLPPN